VADAVDVPVPDADTDNVDVPDADRVPERLEDAVCVALQVGVGVLDTVVDVVRVSVTL
jgi:hypothetical protein